MSDRNNIVYVIPRPEIGGAEKQLLRLIEHLGDRYRATVVCLDGPGSLLDDFRQHADEVIVLNRRGLFDIVTFTRLLGHIRRINPDTVHTTLYIANLFGGWAARLAGVSRIVVSQRGLGIDPQHSRLKRLVHAVFNGFIGQFSDIRTVNSQAIARRMASYGWDDCHTIYNGILDRVYPTTDRLSDLRTELQVPEDATILTTISRIDPKKDLVTMLRSFRVVLDCRPNTYLLIAGGGFSDYHRTLVEEAHRLDIIDHVRFLGFRDDVAELIALGEISLLSSVTEGLPNAVLESMLLARPVVATAVGGVPELIEDGIEGYLVNSGDSQSFADRVIELIDNPVRREAMGIFGRARALADFSVQTTVEKTTANYAKHLTQREHKEYTIPAQDVREPWEATTPNEWARTA